MPKKKMSIAPLNISKEQVKEIEQLRNNEGRVVINKSASKPQKKSYLDALLGKVESLEVKPEPIVASLTKNSSVVDELSFDDIDSTPSEVGSVFTGKASLNNENTIVPSVGSDAKPEAGHTLERKSSDESWVSYLSSDKSESSYVKVGEDDIIPPLNSQKSFHYR